MTAEEVGHPLIWIKIIIVVSNLQPPQYVCVFISEVSLAVFNSMPDFFTYLGQILALHG